MLAVLRVHIMRDPESFSCWKHFLHLNLPSHQAKWKLRQLHGRRSLNSQRRSLRHLIHWTRAGWLHAFIALVQFIYDWLCISTNTVFRMFIFTQSSETCSTKPAVTAFLIREHTSHNVTAKETLFGHCQWCIYFLSRYLVSVKLDPRYEIEMY